MDDLDEGYRQRALVVGVVMVGFIAATTWFDTPQQQTGPTKTTPSTGINAEYETAVAPAVKMPDPQRPTAHLAKASGPNLASPTRK